MPRPASLLRPLVHRLHAYTPGEQPKVKGLIKLNTNENPYPPSPKVLAAVRSAVDGRLRLYPNPSAEAVRDALARHHGCSPDQIIVGNGSDELLALAVRTFTEPVSEDAPGPVPSRSKVHFFSPSYSLYPVLADTHGAVPQPVPLKPDYSLPSVAELKRGKLWDFKAALTLVTTPNAPSGRGYPTAELDALCRAQKGVVVLDEAYVDFAEENAFELALRHPHVLVSRTFSKAYSLCFQRVGYFVGNVELIAGLHKMRDSYNVNGLGQIAAAATMQDLAYYRRNFARIKATREQLRRELTGLGWEVLPSQTNFLLTRPAQGTAEAWLAALRKRKLLVRWFSSPGLRDWLRITVGTETEASALLRAVRAIQRAE